MSPVSFTKQVQTQSLPARGVYSSGALDRQNNYNIIEKIISVWNRYLSLKQVYMP